MGEERRINLKKEIGKAENPSKPNGPSTNGEEPKKKQVRCRNFPNCLNKEDCPFVHPTEKCKYFPACSNGEKCIYLHPEIECKFGLNCSR